jgi:hypothetical protein
VVEREVAGGKRLPSQNEPAKNHINSNVREGASSGREGSFWSGSKLKLAILQFQSLNTDSFSTGGTFYTETFFGDQFVSELNLAWNEEMI